MRPRYRNLVSDSRRWEGFETRPGDIIVCTPPKCGTTWTQMICALLILQDPELPAPLSVLSPWIDMLTRAKVDVFADLAAQDHRRFYKTHTPLDGLPRAADVTYLCVGRDPRDVALSMDNHMENLSIEEFTRRRDAAAARDGIEPGPPPVRRPRPASGYERFWDWVNDETPVTDSGSTLRFTMHHLRTVWDAREELDVVFLHYDELLVDLDGEMRRLSHRLGISITEDTWPGLVKAATFDEMRSRAELTAPGQSGQWRDASRFFNRGTSGQWQSLLGEQDQVEYAARVRSLAPADLVAWVHRIALGDEL